MTLATSYSQALERILSKKGVDEVEVYKNLRAHLTATGRLKLLPGILQSLRMSAAQRMTQEPLLEVASEEERKEAETAAKAMGIDTKAKVNPDLVRGWRLRANGTVTDRSAKRALIDLYRRVTA